MEIDTICRFHAVFLRLILQTQEGGSILIKLLLKISIFHSIILSYPALYPEQQSTDSYHHKRCIQHCKYESTENFAVARR